MAAFWKRLNRRQKLSVCQAFTVLLTMLAMIPYDKQLVGLLPPTAQPYILLTGVVLNGALQFWKAVMKAVEETPADSASKSSEP